MPGKLKIYKDKCDVTLSTTATALATTTGTVHYMTTYNPQIRAGQSIGIGNITVSSVIEEIYNNVRRSKVTLSSSTTINANTALTFTSNDNTFTTSGRVGETSSFKITVQREVGNILSPNPSINFEGVHSIANYKVVSSDTFENVTELIKREYDVTFKVPVKKIQSDDIVYLKADTIVDETGVNDSIYGYEFLANAPGVTIESLTNKKSSFQKDLSNIGFPSKKNINKKAETRLLIVYGDPGVTFKLGVKSNNVSLNHEASSVTNQTTLNLSGSADGTLINKGMTITAMGGGTSITSGVKVVSKDTSGSPDTVTLNLAQSAATDELITFTHVLVADNTVKTIGNDGMYTEYLEFPKNNSSANLTFTITLTENTSGSFIPSLSTPETFSIVSLAVAQAAPVYLTTNRTRVEQANQIPTTSVVSTGNATVVSNQSALSNENLAI
tara:strand:- start:1937 stop:3262 length:1326 start_codon:yes stop_codon:yes gene_type:complete